MSMSFLFSVPEIDEIKKRLGLQHFEIRLSSAWGSRENESRENLHLHLKNTIPENFPRAAVSVSHSMSLGGYAFTKDSGVQIGLDIEETERVTDEVARRVCKTLLEFTTAPSPASLWTAKEASYKALLGPHQPTVISDMRVGNWESPAETVFSHLETFQFHKDDLRHKFNNHGAVTSKDLYTIAFFSFRP